MHLILEWDDENPFASANSVMYIEGCGTAVIFSLKVRGGNIILFESKGRNTQSSMVNLVS